MLLLYIQHYIKTVHFWLEYNRLAMYICLQWSRDSEGIQSTMFRLITVHSPT